LLAALAANLGLTEPGLNGLLSDGRALATAMFAIG